MWGRVPWVIRMCQVNIQVSLVNHFLVRRRDGG
jgi:hypothetical protein